VRRAALALASAAALGGCGLFGGGDEPIEQPAELVEFEPSLRLERLWSESIGGDSERLRLALEPATDGARIYAAAHDGRVAAIDATDGRRAWRVDTDLPLSAGPGYGDGLLALGSSDGDLLLLSATDGREIWREDVGSEVLSVPAIGAGLVVLQTVDGRLLALSVADGTRQWVIEQSVPRLSLRGTASPVIAGDRVVTGFDNGRVGAYTLMEGEAIWEITLSPPSGRTEIERLVDINTQPLVVGGDVYVVAFQGRLASLALESGQLLWARDLSSYAGMNADLTNLYITDQSSEVIALSRRSGTPNWVNDSMRLRELTAPVPFGNAVVVGDLEGYAHWLNPDTGDLMARERVGSAAVRGFVVVSDVLVVQTEGGDVTAWRVRDTR
jgi:outer membrane protein assembly factor BamB